MGYAFGIIVFITIILVVHSLAVNINSVTNSQYFYGVYIKNIEIDIQEKSRIDKYLKKKLNMVVLLLIAIFCVISRLSAISTGLYIVVLTALYMVFAFIYLKSVYKEVKKIKDNIIISENSNVVEKHMPKKVIVDTVFVREKEKINNKFSILFRICIGISISSLLYTIISYNNNPGIVEDIASVFITNISELTLVLLFAIMGNGIMRMRTPLDINDIEINRKRAIKYLNRMGYCYFLIILSMQIMTSGSNIAILNQKPFINSLIFLMIILILLPSLMMSYYYIMLQTLKTKDKSLYSVEHDNEKWIYGVIYYNEDDPCLMVRSRIDAMNTFNMAKIKSKIITVILCAGIVLSLALAFVG